MHPLHQAPQGSRFFTAAHVCTQNTAGGKINVTCLAARPPFLCSVLTSLLWKEEGSFVLLCLHLLCVLISPEVASEVCAPC